MRQEGWGKLNLGELCVLPGSMQLEGSAQQGESGEIMKGAKYTYVQLQQVRGQIDVANIDSAVCCCRNNVPSGILFLRELCHFVIDIYCLYY